MSKTVAVILAGSGVYDGSEINEVVLTLLALEEQGVEYQCFAPDIDQAHVVNHLSGDEQNQTRNVLQEAARIRSWQCEGCCKTASTRSCRVDHDRWFWRCEKFIIVCF